MAFIFSKWRPKNRKKMQFSKINFSMREHAQAKLMMQDFFTHIVVNISIIICLAFFRTFKKIDFSWSMVFHDDLYIILLSYVVMCIWSVYESARKPVIWIGSTIEHVFQPVKPFRTTGSIKNVELLYLNLFDFYVFF